MASIQVDENTAKLIEQQARVQGLTISEYLQSILPLAPASGRASWDEIEQQIVSLSTSDGSQPDVIRTDIYDDQD